MCLLKGTAAVFMHESLMLQLAEAEAELDAMTKDRDELQAAVDELEEKVIILLTVNCALLLV